MRLLYASALLLCTVACPSLVHAQQSSSSSAELDTLMAHFSQAWSSDDDSTLSALLTDDVVLITTDEVVSGHSNAMRWFRGRMEDAGKFAFVPEQSEANGRFAHAMGEWSLTRGEGATLGRHTFVFEQDADAGWQLTAMQLLRDPVNAEASGNNAFASAFGIELDQPVRDRISEAGQADYFVLLVPASGVLDAVLEPVPSDQRFTVTLYDEEQKEQGTKTAAAVGGRAAAMARVEPGRYYVRVHGGRRGAPTSDEPYTLTASLDRTDRFEINNSFAQAAEVSVSQEIVGTIRGANEVDFFRFDVTEPGTYTFALDPSPAALRLNLGVFDGQPQELGRRKRASGQGAGIFIDRDLSAGTYYVRINATIWRGEGDPEPYTLRVTRK